MTNEYIKESRSHVATLLQAAGTSIQRIRNQFFPLCFNAENAVGNAAFEI